MVNNDKYKDDAEYHTPDILNYVKEHGHLPSAHSLEFYRELEKCEEQETDGTKYYDHENPAGYPKGGDW